MQMAWLTKIFPAFVFNKNRKTFTRKTLCFFGHSHRASFLRCFSPMQYSRKKSGFAMTQKKSFL